MARRSGREWRTPLLGEIAGFIQGGGADEDKLTSLAHRLARTHYEQIPLYRRLAEMRRFDPNAPASLSDIPAVPTEAFKRVEMHIDPASVTRRYQTSGTSGGEERRGVSCFSEDDMALMDAAIDGNAAKYLFPDGEKTLILILAPSPEHAPKMIMAYGMKRLVLGFGREGSGFFVGPGGLDMTRLMGALEEAGRNAVPVTLIGASFGFVHLFEAMAQQAIHFELAAGSRVMDAGGFKGKSRRVDRDEMISQFGEFFGIEAAFCVNLLGLTEHASQFYDDSLRAHYLGKPAHRCKKNPPWTRTWAVNPENLKILPHGETGLLRHLDLANGGHPFVVQTDDLGHTTPEGFVVHGPAGATQSRGCSLTVDELMSPAKGGA